MDEKEALIRLALAAPHTPWVSIFRLGATCEHRTVIGWFPCALLVSAAHRSRRVAMQYRSWLPETPPVFDRKEARQRFAEFCGQTQPGTWISRNNAGIHSAECFLRGSRIVSGMDGDEIEAESVYFPEDATVPPLEAARTLRVFYRTGLRANHIPWIASRRTTANDDEFDQVCPARSKLSTRAARRESAQPDYADRAGHCAMRGQTRTAHHGQHGYRDSFRD